MDLIIGISSSVLILSYPHSPNREKGQVAVPISSRHTALSLLLELALHRAILHKLLEIVFLLLLLAGRQVWEIDITCLCVKLNVPLYVIG